MSPLHRAAAMKAKCADCMNQWADGRVDCHIHACPLYAWQPYRKGTPTFSMPIVQKKPCTDAQEQALLKGRATRTLLAGRIAP